MRDRIPVGTSRSGRALFSGGWLVRDQATNNSRSLSRLGHPFSSAGKHRCKDQPITMRSNSKEPEASGDIQRERAVGAWELIVDLRPDCTEDVERLRRTLGFSRSDCEALSAALPGCVRRGARVDLEELLEKLLSEGFESRLQRRGE
jgi:hypothetical protein